MVDAFALTAPEQVSRAAVVSDCLRYRYALERRWGDPALVATFILLNPSTADGMEDDPTVRRLIGFAKAWGYGRLIVVNLFAWRATDPGELRRAAEPIGPQNDRYIRAAIDRAHERGVIVCGWGKHGGLNGRDRAVLSIIRDAGAYPRYLRLNGDGTPAHPLYLPGHLLPTLWRVAA